MRSRHAVLVAVAAAFAFTPVVSAGADARKQRVQITMNVYPQKTFVLSPLGPGALENDSGTHACKRNPVERGEVLRDGQESFPWECSAWVFTGKRGTLVLRSEFAWIEAGGASNVATGTWRVVRGTGQYARVIGNGRSAQIGSPSRWIARYQGYFASR